MGQLRVGMVGHAFMGAAHSQAWRTVNHAFDLPLSARMSVVCGRDDQRAAAAAAKLGWESHATDWRQVIARDDLDLVDICTPGDTHAEIAVAALAAGKHVLCEKPLANSVAEAREMAAAAAVAQTHGIQAMCGFNYRRVPAVALMRQLVATGRIGTVRHVRAVYLQDWIVDPEFPLVWRLRKDVAGSGALGDIGAHIVDLTQFVTGNLITSVTALTETFVRERPLPAPSLSGNGQVTVDDAALFLARLDGGAVATYEATRFATGRKNGLRVELNGSLGSVAFDFERMNELEFYDATRPTSEQGFNRILVTEPDHPYMAAWWPAGHLIGYEHSFTHEVRDLIAAIASNNAPAPSFADALQVQLVLDAVERSAATSAWVAVEPELAPV
ncbi:Gfo/Idh/MocA family oxidoreductase [Winogradskya consettensis]|uniref:Oxidoreductase n=1 Tax=Winogradskya consettensis TaxID=113560 RepID=A0A919SBI2_9ACTN|nr:Gfo/Idh/MocA family oxidoreductase [Actinoplanes consettensis]GIM68544.1 oxidoreductase [Actinoplanes consettensis]